MIYPTPLPFRRHFQAIEEPFVLLAVAASVGGEHAGAGRAREESPRSVQAKASPLPPDLQDHLPLQNSN